MKMKNRNSLRQPDGATLVNRFAARQPSLRMQDGGAVPGKGAGDKIPALYEPGEFIVSNAMLKAEPGLREQLRDLRGNVLARKGVTPEQADAKALGYDDGPSGGQYGQENAERSSAVSGRTQVGQGASLRGGAEVGRPLDGQGLLRSSGHLSNPEAARPGRVSLRALDGFEVSERPWNGAADTRTFARQAGPGNPVVGPSGSPQAAAYQQARAPSAASTPAAAPAPTANVGRLRGAVDATKNFLTAGGESAGSVGGAFKSVASPIIGAGKSALRAAGKLAAPLTAATSIYDGLTTDTDTYAKRFGLENTEPGLARDLGVRTLGVASDIGNNLTFGLAKKYLYRDGSEAQSMLPQSLRGSPMPPIAPKPAAPSLRDPAVITPVAAPAQAPTQAPTLRDNGQALRTAQRDAQTQKDIALGNQMQADRQAQEAQGYAAQDRQVAVGQAQSDRVDQERAAQRANATLSSIMTTPAAKAQKTVAAQTLRDIGGRALQGDKDRAEALRSGAADAARSRVAGMNNATTLRGQDLDYAAKLATAKGTTDADRKYELDVARFGVEVANKQRDDKRAGDESFSKRIASMVGKDVDGSIAARVVNGANLFVGDAIRAAEAELRANPGNAKAARDLKRLQEGGVGSLDDRMVSQLVLGQQAGATAREYDGFMPWSGNAKNSAAPIKSLSLRKGLVFDDYVSDSDSGNQTIPARALRDRPDLNRLVVQ